MSVIDLIFPKKCLGCNKEGKYICISCLKKMPYLKQKCPYCEKPSIDGTTHTKCTKRLRINGIYSLWPYQSVIRKAILNLKFKFAKDIATELSEYMFLILKKQAIFPKNSIVVPVPLHFFRKNFRGFNQSDIIADKLSQRMGWIYLPNIMQRRTLGKSQAGLKEKDRKKNIKGVFSLSPNYQLLPTNYILFDDVCTTGSTLKEAARVLKKGGAMSVWGLTIAR